MSTETQIVTAVDYDRNGKQEGYLEVPQSTNTAGWRTQYIPIVVVQNGSGPTALFFGGNHGDEYEGPVTLLNLARKLDPGQVQGRIILVPMLNLPALENGTRLSPVDGMNMNRAFPGDAQGALTSMIAHYVTHVLFPLADTVMDIHSGGRSLKFLPSANMHQVADKGQMQGMVDAAMAWGAPYVFIYRDVGGTGLLPGEAERLGKVTLGTEMGSATQFSPDILAMTARGVRNVLRHWQILDDGQGLEQSGTEPQIVGATEREDYVMAPISGIFEPFVELGDSVDAGDSLGQIHSLEEPYRAPTPVIAQTGGLVMGRRGFPLTKRGDNVATLVRPFSLG